MSAANKSRSYTASANFTIAQPMSVVDPSKFANHAQRIAGLAAARKRAMDYTPTLLASSLNVSADRVARALGFCRADPFYRTICMEFKTALKGRLFKGE